MFNAQRKDFNNWLVVGEYKVINGFDVIVCEKTNLCYHIDKKTLIKS